jgi:hypothetical protein
MSLVSQRGSDEVRSNSIVIVSLEQMVEYLLVNGIVPRGIGRQTG